MSAPSRAAVLLVNLGTPDQPTPAAVSRYLRQIGIRFREGIVHEDIAWITESDLRAPE